MKKSVTAGTAGKTLRLFTSTSETCATNMTMYYFKAYINDELVLDLIPVAANQTIENQTSSANGFFDNVTNKFMYSSGSEYKYNTAKFKQKEIPKNSYQYTGLNSDTLYNIKVKAILEDGSEIISDTINAKTKIADVIYPSGYDKYMVYTLEGYASSNYSGKYLLCYFTSSRSNIYVTDNFDKSKGYYTTTNAQGWVKSNMDDIISILEKQTKPSVYWNATSYENGVHFTNIIYSNFDMYTDSSCEEVLFKANPMD